MNEDKIEFSTAMILQTKPQKQLTVMMIFIEEALALGNGPHERMIRDKLHTLQDQKK